MVFVHLCLSLDPLHADLRDVCFGVYPVSVDGIVREAHDVSITSHRCDEVQFWDLLWLPRYWDRLYVATNVLGLFVTGCNEPRRSFAKVFMSRLVDVGDSLENIESGLLL